MKSSLYDSRDRSRSFTSIYFCLKRKVSRPPTVFAIFCKPFSRSSGESSLYDFRDRSRAFTSIISIFFLSECQHMIRSILTWDPRRRVTMAQVLGHSWLSGEGSKVRVVYLTKMADHKNRTNCPTG